MTRHKGVLLLLAIFCFSFLFRVAIIFHNDYPPSSDIGLHGSIINMILEEERLPSWNPYHMGGEQLATPPGFHFFVSILILLTRMPLILAQLITAAFFSSIIVFPAYLVSKRIMKNPNAGILAAFFAAISALSIEMISWGGYTNIVSLALIIIIFYLFIRDVDKPTQRHLLIGALLFGTLLITHTFSLSVFLPILAFYLVLLIAGKLWKFKEIKILNMFRFFIVSALLGTVAVSPWILRVFKFYIGATSEGALTGGLDNRNIILANRTVEPIILTLIVVIIPLFLMLKDSRKRYVDMSSLLLIAWFLVPVVMTQAYIFGIYTDYSRFMYFIDFPGIIIISASLLYLSRYTTMAINKFPKITSNKIKKVLHVIVFNIIIFIFIIVSLWSIFPREAMTRADFYTTIQQPEAIALEWIKNNTLEDSVLVADHLYGWWLSGIAERPTLSAAGLEFLIYSHELEVAMNASLLLDTNYLIDNGLIQVRDDGPYVSRHNPVFSVETWSGEAFPVFYFQENETVIEYKKKYVYGNVTLSKMEITETAITKNNNLTVLTVTREDNSFTVKKTLQIQRGVEFAELSYEITAKKVNRNISAVNFTIHTTADEPFKIENNTTTSIINATNSYRNITGTVIAPRAYHITETQNNTNCLDIMYKTLNPIANVKIKFLVGKFDDGDSNSLRVIPDDPIAVWDYTEMINNYYNVSYVLCRDQDIYHKFSDDPNFRLVFNCGNVAVFQIAKLNEKPFL